MAKKAEISAGLCTLRKNYAFNFSTGYLILYVGTKTNFIV